MRAFYVVWAGQFISAVGTGLSAFAIGVWLFQRTQLVTPLALLLLLRTLPVVILSPVAGVWVDRWDRRLTILLSDLGAALSTGLMLALFVFTDFPVLGIYVAVVLASVCETFQRPAFLASITLLVPKAQHGRAAGMTQLANGAAEVISPLAAGLLIGSIGIRGILLIDVATFLVAVATLAVVRFPSRTLSIPLRAKRVLLSEVREAVRCIVSHPGLGMLLLVFTAIGFQRGIISALIRPLILSFTTPQVLGFIFAIAGTGYLAGGLLLTLWGGPRRRSAGVMIGTFVFGLFLIVIGLRPLTWLVALAATGAHFFLPLVSGMNQAIWQGEVEQALQGRVFALREMATRAALLLAYVVVGPIADKLLEPMLMPGATLAGTVGTIVGTGSGRGTGLAFSLSGLFVVLLGILGLANRRVRSLDAKPNLRSS